MENKQSAVKWIESKLNSVKPTDFCSIETIKNWVQEEKEMDKEEFQKLLNVMADYKRAKEYYKETYGE